ncbi:MAG: hypothetical protein ACFFFD_11590, partial [Promethearchaeota archaeon]
GGFWKFKRENGLSLRKGLAEAWISPKLEPWAKDLQAMHGIEKLNFTDSEGQGTEVALPDSEEVIYVTPLPDE